MTWSGCDSDDVSDILRQASQQHNEPVRELAARIVDSLPGRPERDPDPRDPAEETSRLLPAAARLSDHPARPPAPLTDRDTRSFGRPWARPTQTIAGPLPGRGRAASLAGDGFGDLLGQPAVRLRAGHVRADAHQRLTIVLACLVST